MRTQIFVIVYVLFMYFFLKTIDVNSSIHNLKCTDKLNYMCHVLTHLDLCQTLTR